MWSATSYKARFTGCLRCGIVSVCEFGAKLLSSYIHCQTFKARAAWDSWPTDKARLDSLVWVLSKFEWGLWRQVGAIVLGPVLVSFWHLLKRFVEWSYWDVCFVETDTDETTGLAVVSGGLRQLFLMRDACGQIAKDLKLSCMACTDHTAERPVIQSQHASFADAYCGFCFRNLCFVCVTPSLCFSFFDQQSTL